MQELEDVRNGNLKDFCFSLSYLHIKLTHSLLNVSRLQRGSSQIFHYNDGYVGE